MHDTGPAGYPYEVVSRSWGRENLDVKSADNNMGGVSIESWVTLAKGTQLLAAAGHDFETLKKAATRCDFEPVPLNAKASFADHFAFAKQGVTTLYIDSGTGDTDKPPAIATRSGRCTTNNNYHKVSDEAEPDWNLPGAVEDTRLLYLVGWRVAHVDAWPEWKPGTEFRPSLRSEIPTEDRIASPNTSRLRN